MLEAQRKTDEVTRQLELQSRLQAEQLEVQMSQMHRRLDQLHI